jgi:hypothetical protein
MSDEMRYIALYHDGEVEEEKEIGLRQLIEGVMTSFRVEPGRLPPPSQLVPIPNTTDFLAVYQTNSEITFTFKHFGDLTKPELLRLGMADLYLTSLRIVEGRWKSSIAQMVTDAPEDQTIPVGEFPGIEEAITNFREEVRELVDQEVAKHRDRSREEL